MFRPAVRTVGISFIASLPEAAQSAVVRKFIDASTVKDTTSATNSLVAELAEPRDLATSPLFKSLNHTLSSWRKVTCEEAGDFVSEGPVKMGTLHFEDPEDRQGTTVFFGFGIIPIAPQSKRS